MLDISAESLDGCWAPTKDLRSASVSVKRARKARQKYFSYRSNHPGTGGQPYIAFAGTQRRKDSHPSHTSPSGIPIPTLSDKTSIRIWTKRDLWLERTSNIWPLRNPHHYGRCRGCHTQRPGGWRSRKEEREEWGRDVDVEDARFENLFRWCDCTMCTMDQEIRFGGLERWVYLFGDDGEGEGSSSASAVDDVEGEWALEHVSGEAGDLEADLAKDLGFELIEQTIEWSDSDEWSEIGSHDGLG